MAQSCPHQQCASITRTESVPSLADVVGDSCLVAFVCFWLLISCSGCALIPDDNDYHELLWSKYRLLGTRARTSGNIKTSRDNFSLALSEAERLKPADIRLGKSLTDLAESYALASDNARAKSLFSQSTSMLQGQLNESKEEQYKNSVALELCRSLSGLGSVYLAERNFASSETSFRRALKLAGERWKASSTKWQQNDWAEILATTLGRLGDLFRDWNKLPEADRYYKLALKIVTATPTSKYLMPDIASREIQLLHQMGRDDEVKALEQSSAGAKSGNSQSNREDEKVADQIEAELSKGRNYLDAKDYPQALQCFLQAKDMAKALRPKHLPACLLLIGRVYSDQGKYEEAIDSLSQAMAYEQARNGPTSWLVSAMAIEMGECYQKWGKNEKAEIYFEKSAHIEEMSPREAASNWRLQIALAKLATLFKTEGKVPQARQTEARLEKALNRPFILVDSRPDSVKEQLKCWLNKCDIYKSQNRLSKVDLVREQTIQLAEKYLGTSNQTMIDDFKIQLAAQYAAEGNYGKSAQLYRSVLMTEGLEKCAKSHRDELKTYEGVLRHLGRVAEASELNGRLGR